MKSRKQRHPARSGGSKKKVPSDVSPATSLPPLVEGPLRCFLRVTVSRVLWTVHKPPSSTFIRLRWWGESSNGTHFFPRDGSQLSQKTVKTTARFPIRCGPKQFTSYLTDMSCLVLEVLTKPDHLPIARAQVAGISRLTLSHPIGGFYTLVSPTSEKLGELQVSLNLEPLTEAYDSSSSGPVTDISAEGQQVTALTVPSRPRSLSAGSGKESVGSGGNTPRGKDHLYFQNAQKDGGKEESLENQMPTTNVNPPVQDPHGQTSNDILSVILERGNKLKNAMVVSALMDSAPALKDTPLPLPKDNILPHSKPFPSSSGILLQNILHADSTLKHSDDVTVASDCNLDMDNRAVDLLLGSLNTSPLPVWDGDDSLPESLSGHSSVCEDSELNDPQYDQSLLENLFYKTPTSDIRADDTEPEGRGAASLSKTQTQSESKISGGPASEPQRSPESAGLPPGVSAELLNFLSSIRLARVTIESLSVAAAAKPTTPRKTSGKPPRPLTSRKCTYFIEYAFPVASTSGRSKGGAGEVTRVVSNKVSGGVVKFQQNSMFPVHFSTAAIKKWWETDLVFKVYSRKSDQKKPTPIGQAVHPLSSLLQSKPLSQCVILPVQNIAGNSETQEIGPLKVSLELIGGSNSKPTPRDASPSRHAPVPQRETSPRSQHVVESSAEGPRLNIWSPQKPSKAPSPHPGLFTSPHPPRQQEEENPEVLLHTLLMVPDGRNFSCSPTGPPNVYLNCKLWCEETARSAVSWGQANPSFNFVQVTPVTLTSKLLERMKNNVMVIEVWQKTGSSGQDRLLGIVKLPLHQFYLSFRDPKISRLLLQAQFPVLGVDCYMPLIDVFSGSCRGQLRVVLAMGRSEQIIALQRTRDEEHDRSPYLVRPVHLLDHQPRSPTQVNAPQDGAMREHVFVMRVERINGLTPLQSTVWGEADCYIQYSFPFQEDPEENLDQDLIESSVNLKPFRTTTTLCVPDPEFGHSETHVLLVPEGVPVQRLLLSCLSTRGLSSGGGVQFEVWCRYYYPNVRDQLVAKGVLPLSRLCAMVTMQRQHPDEAQMFSLPLIPRTDGPAGRQPQPSGLLDVCIRYKHRPVRRQATRGVAARVVTLVVEVHRASGLQAAARVLSEQDEGFSYFAGVGVNAYVTVQLSFLPESERRCTRVAARTFSPEFEHHMEVCCDLLTRRSSGETCSLAEQLEDASAVFTVWNKDSRKAVHTQKQKDMVLGSVKIPLADLIHKRTGISGWFGVYVPQETGSSRGQHVLVGGLELSISFAHHSERERVVKAAQGVSWETQNETLDDEDAWTDATRQISLTLSMPRAWIPVHCLLLPGLNQLERSTYCYFRYKFYDQEAFCSPVRRPSLEEEGEGGPASVSFQGSRTVELRSSRPLMWYLREEKLEVQVWVAFTKDKTPRPRDTDRLVGSAFIDLTTLTKTSQKKQTISGVYPLFRRSAADLQGAALRVHITMTTGLVHGDVEAVPAGLDVQEDSDNEGEAADRVPSPTTPKKHKNKSSPDVTALQHTDSDDSFPVTVVVDQAMHLSLKGCPLSDRSEVSLSCCVSYVTADSAESVFTEVVSSTDCPVWSHQLECRLSNQLLVDPQQSLVFKVWHKGEAERVIGFVSVDLSPLVCGLQSVCGWYNITDFSGHCHGQLKVSITPLKALHDLRGRRKTINQEPARSSLALPHNYNTTATCGSFPSHVSRHPEQKTQSLDHTDGLFSQRSSESERHFEHMDNVRLYHQSLQEQTAAADLNPSSSLLFSALRKKLSELDDVQRYFSRKLTTPTFPTASDQDGRVQQEDTETDTSRLLLKSNHLVGQVNNIINGLRGHHLETIVSDPQSSSTTSPVGENPLQTVPETSSSPHRPPRSPEDITSLSSPARPSRSHQDTRCLSRLSQSHQDVSSLSSPHRPSWSHQDVSSLSSPHRPSQSHQDTMCLSRPPQSHQDTTSLSSPPRPAWSHQDPVSPPGSPQDRVSPLQFPKTPEGHADSESEEDRAGQNHRVSEDDDEEGTDEDGPGGTWDDEADDEEDGEDYEEVVLKPRSLNEVTSLTDRTSPWTSVLSDAGSLDEDDSEDEEDDGMKTRGGRGSSDGEDEDDRMKTRGGRGSSGDVSDGEDDRMKTGGRSDSLHESSGDVSDTERDGERTKSPEDGASLSTPHATITHDASCSPETTIKPSSRLDVPNFFLPSHQLEASLRAIRLAPSFSQTSSHPGPSSAFPRIPRRLPDMSPTSRKKETDRIARIFSTRCDDHH